MSTDTFPMWAIELRLLEVTYDSDTRALVHCKQLERIQMGDGNSADEISQFYRELSKLPFLSAGLRNAIMNEAGVPVRKHKQGYEAGRTEALWAQINECKAQMRAAKEKPEGGIHDAAVAKVAEAHGMNAEALRRRLTRLRQS